MNKGWQEKKLGDIFTIERGGSPRPIDKYLTNSPDGINWIKIGDTKNITKYITETKEKIIPEGVRRSRMVYEGDFILSNSMSFGKPYIMKTSGCIHDGWLVLREKETSINKDFLYYILGSDLIFQQFDILAAGSTVRNLNIGLVSRVKIPIPPLSEQQRIVDILDQSFVAIDQAIENTEKNLENTELLVQNLINNIFSNETNNWKNMEIGHFCYLENGDRGTNYPSKNVRTSKGIPFINAGHLTNDGIDFTSMNYISKERFDLLGSGKIKADDILFCLRGSLGKFASVGDLKEGAIASSLVIIRVTKLILNEFLLIYLRSNMCKEMINKYKNGAAQPNLSAGSLKKFLVPVPEINEQIMIIQKIKELSTRINDLESLYKMKNHQLQELKQSILHKAFNGELT